MGQAEFPHSALRHGEQTPEVRTDLAHLLGVCNNDKAVKFAEHVKRTAREEHQKCGEESAIDSFAQRHDARAGSVSDINHRRFQLCLSVDPTSLSLLVPS